LIEIVTPRTNAAIITPAENLLAAIALAEPIALEMVATATSRRFLVRAGSAATRRHLMEQLAAAYPQAELRHLDTAHCPEADPARLQPEEQVVAAALVLRGPAYLPLRTFRDAEVDAARNAQADPMLGILSALGDLPDRWRALMQLVLRPAPDDWCRAYLRLAVEHPLAAERASARADTSLTSVVVLAGLLGAGALSLHAYGWFVAGAWLELGLLAGGALTGSPGLVWVARRLTDRPIYDMRLVQEKVSRPAYLAELRAAVVAPAHVPRTEVEARLARLVATYRQFNLAAGNGLVPRRLDLRQRDLRALLPLLPTRRTPILTTRELAGLWHLPQAGADIPLLERTTARRRLPMPGTVTHGCRIGVSLHQGHTVPVALSDELLHRHLLLVAKTRRGKSSLLLRLAQYAMEARAALVLVDPHRDLARAALGLAPPERQDDVVFLDVAERDRPFGLNLLDTGLFADRDKAVANALAVFRREFDRFWGPRMEDAFRFALLTLYEVNQAICAADPDGQRRQHTILDVPFVLVDTAFRRSLLPLVDDPVIRTWWAGYFDLLDRRLQVEVSNPVQTKVQKFAGSRAARSIVGQPCSTIEPSSWLRDGAIVIINTAKGIVGEDTAALVGATLLNLAALAIGEQAALDPRQRRAVTFLIDEFHTMPGTDYEAILSELAKYGANLILATQSLAKLAALDREQHRALRSTVFANLDGLVAFHTSAEDAQYLVRELGEEVDEHDLVSLGEHQCYARISAGGERLPTFSLRLDPPPASDPALADQLATASAAHYGRAAAVVEHDLRSALARIESSHRATLATSQAGQAGAGIAKGAMTSGERGSRGSPAKARNEHRRQKPRRNDAHQATLFESVSDAPGAGPASTVYREGDEPSGEAEPVP
jgi:hypothetical protein